MVSKPLYVELVDITKDYLGPVADRFVIRQIETHLSIQPSQLTSKNIAELAQWLILSMSLLISDTKAVENFRKRIRHLEK
jgi:hypothetical protein